MYVAVKRGTSGVSIMTRTINVSAKSVVHTTKFLSHILMVKTNLMFVVNRMKLYFVLVIIKMVPVVLHRAVLAPLIAEPMIWTVIVQDMDVVTPENPTVQVTTHMVLVICNSAAQGHLTVIIITHQGSVWIRPVALMGLFIVFYTMKMTSVKKKPVVPER